MTDLVTLQINDKVAHIQLHNGKANAISHELLDQLNTTLDQAEEAKAVVLLSGQPGILSGGYDLKVMQQSMSAAVELVQRGSKLSHRLLSFPTPVVIACTGHAVAKGAFLLLSADVRIGIQGDYKIGLNEVAIGMTMHNAGLEIAKFRLTPNYFTRSVICAEIFNPKEAVKAGFLDLLVEEEQLLPQAQDLAQQLAKLNLNAFKGTKLKARKAFLAQLEQAIASDKDDSL